MRRTVLLTHRDVRIGRSKSGLGLFARRPLSPGMFVEYTGDLIPTPVADTMKRAKYLFEINKHWTINGAPRTNLARYINHSCEPNAESAQRGTRVFIVITKPVAAGEELTYDYGEEYVDEFIKPHGCRCRKCIIK